MIHLYCIVIIMYAYRYENIIILYYFKIIYNSMYMCIYNDVLHGTYICT